MYIVIIACTDKMAVFSVNIVHLTPLRKILGDHLNYTEVRICICRHTPESHAGEGALNLCHKKDS